VVSLLVGRESDSQHFNLPRMALFYRSSRTPSGLRRHFPELSHQVGHVVLAENSAGTIKAAILRGK